MAKALRYRLFGIGKMPAELTAASSSPDVLIAAEGLSIRQTVDALKIPRASVRHGVRLLIGSAVLFPDRLLLSAGKSVIVDTVLEPQPEAAATLAFHPDGIFITVDVASVVDQGSGSMELHYKLALDAALLARLPLAPLRAPILRSPGLVNGWNGSHSR